MIIYCHQEHELPNTLTCPTKLLSLDNATDPKYILQAWRFPQLETLSSIFLGLERLQQFTLLIHLNIYGIGKHIDINRLLEGLPQLQSCFIMEWEPIETPIILKHAHLEAFVLYPSTDIFDDSDTLGNIKMNSSEKEWKVILEDCPKLGILGLYYAGTYPCILEVKKRHPNIHGMDLHGSSFQFPFEDVYDLVPHAAITVRGAAGLLRKYKRRMILKITKDSECSSRERRWCKMQAKSYLFSHGTNECISIMSEPRRPFFFLMNF